MNISATAHPKADTPLNVEIVAPHDSLDAPYIRVTIGGLVNCITVYPTLDYATDLARELLLAVAQINATTAVAVSA